MSAPPHFHGIGGTQPPSDAEVWVRPTGKKVYVRPDEPLHKKFTYPCTSAEDDIAKKRAIPQLEDGAPGQTAPEASTHAPQKPSENKAINNEPMNPASVPLQGPPLQRPGPASPKRPVNSEIEVEADDKGMLSFEKAEQLLDTLNLITVMATEKYTLEVTARRTIVAGERHVLRFTGGKIVLPNSIPKPAEGEDDVSLWGQKELDHSELDKDEFSFSADKNGWDEFHVKEDIETSIGTVKTFQGSEIDEQKDAELDALGFKKPDPLPVYNDAFRTRDELMMKQVREARIEEKTQQEMLKRGEQDRVPEKEGKGKALQQQKVSLEKPGQQSDGAGHRPQIPQTWRESLDLSQRLQYRSSEERKEQLQPARLQSPSPLHSHEARIRSKREELRPIHNDDTEEDGSSEDGEGKEVVWDHNIRSVASLQPEDENGILINERKQSLKPWIPDDDVLEKLESRHMSQEQDFMPGNIREDSRNDSSHENTSHNALRSKELAKEVAEDMKTFAPELQKGPAEAGLNKAEDKGSQKDSEEVRAKKAEVKKLQKGSAEVGPNKAEDEIVRGRNGRVNAINNGGHHHRNKEEEAERENTKEKEQSTLTRGRVAPAFLGVWPQQQPRMEAPVRRDRALATFDGGIPLGPRPGGRRQHSTDQPNRRIYAGQGPPFGRNALRLEALERRAVGVFVDGLPPGTTQALLVSQVRGGALHSVNMFRTGPGEDKRAVVYFLDSDSAVRFLDSHQHNPVAVMDREVILQYPPPIEVLHAYKSPYLEAVRPGETRVIGLSNVPEAGLSTTFISRWLDGVIGRTLAEGIEFDHSNRTAMLKFLSVETAREMKSRLIAAKLGNHIWRGMRVDFIADPCVLNF
jgi:hypothetical protein